MADFLELLDGLRATRDADSCLRGLNLFRKGLRGEEAPAFLLRYLRQSPDWQELQAVWDAQLTVQHYHVTVTLLLALADGLAVATSAAADDALAPEQRALLAAGAASLAGAVLHRRLKALYFNLSSDMRGKANAALALLAAVVGALGAAAANTGRGGAGVAGVAGVAGGGASLRDFVRAFDWSLSALAGLARPPREKKGESAAELQQRSWQQWGLGDALKRPTRALFSGLALCLLRLAGGDVLLTQQLLQLRPLIGGLLAHLGADPPAQQLAVLQVLQRRVLAAKAGVPAAVQAEVFSDAALQQLANIAATAAAGQEDEDDGGEEGPAKEEGDEEGKARPQGVAARLRRVDQQAAAAAALAILESLVTQPSHGLAAAAPGAVAGASFERFVLADAGSEQLLPGQRRLLRMLLRLRPADSAAHLQLLLAAAGRDAPLAAALLLALPYSLEPAAAAAAAAAGSAAAGRWFAHAAVAARLMQLLPAAAPPGLLLLACSGGGAPPPGGRRAQALLRCCFPPCLQRAALSRGLQHANSLVRYGTLGLLVSAMSALEAVLQDCAAAADAAAATAAPGAGPAPQRELRQGWLALQRWLQQAARQQLPDPTLLLALLSAAEKEGWKEANELQLAAVLRLLLLWQRLLPAALADANVDAERLMPQQALALRPQHQLLLLELLQAAAEAGSQLGNGAEADSAATTAAAAAAAVTSAASLLPPLRLLAGAPQAAVRAEARRWLLQRLLATTAFAGNEEEAVLWLDLLPRGSEAACTFLAEALQLLLRRPHELYEQQQLLLAAAPAAATASGTAGRTQQPQQFSLLAACALRQLLRVLGSAKMPGADKAAAAAYVAGVLRQLAQQQLGSSGSGSTALAAVLLGVARQEAARQQQAQQAQQAAGKGLSGEGGKKEKKRKAAAEGGSDAADDAVGPLVLPAEWRPLLGLLAQLEEHQQLQQGEPAGEEQQPQKKKAKTSKERPTDAPAAGEHGPAAACQAAILADGSSGGGGGDGGTACAGDLAGEGHTDACCCLISRLAELHEEEEEGRGSSSTADQLAAIQQQLAAAGPVGCDGSSGAGAGMGTRSAAVRQCLHLLERPGLRGGVPAALLQALRAAVQAAGGSESGEQQRCLQLLADSSLASAALEGGGEAAAAAPSVHRGLGQTVVQLLSEVLSAGGSSSRAGSSSSSNSSRAFCLPLLQQVSTGFQRAVSEGSGSGNGADGIPDAVEGFLLLLPHMPAAAVEAAADQLLADLALTGQGSRGSEKMEKKRKTKERAEDAAEAPTAPWLAPAAAAVLEQLLLCSSLQHQGEHRQLQRLERACSQLLRLAVVGEGTAFGCLLRLLASGSLRGAARAALGMEGQLQLLRCCLGQGSSTGGLAARSQLAALLVRDSGSSECRQLASELLPPLLQSSSSSSSGAGGGNAELAVALPSAAALLSQPPPGVEGAGVEAEALAAVAAALGQALLAYFSSSGGRGEGSQEGAASKQAKKSGRKGQAAAESGQAGEEASAHEEVGQLLRQHALPCLRLSLQHQPPAAQHRQRLLAALLPQQGWPVADAAAGASSDGGSGGGGSSGGGCRGSGSSVAVLAEAAVLVVTTAPASSTGDGGSGGSGSVQELAACVGCFAATLTSLLRLPAGTSDLEGRLLALLDGPLGDAVAAMPSSQRGTAAFAELAAATAGTLGTAVLRYRLAPAVAAAGEAGSGDGEGAEAEAGAAAACVRAMRVLRRFTAALLPDEAEEAASSSSSSEDGSSSDSDEHMAEQRLQVESPAVASAALQLLQRLLGHSRFLPAMRAAAASPPPLPPAAEAAARPLASLLPLAAVALADGSGAPAGGATAGTTSAAAATSAQMKKELCELIETLLDLHQQYSGTTGSSTSSASEAAQQQQQVAAAEAALLPLLMAGYGASCSPTDAAAWSLAAAINQRQWQREQQQQRQQQQLSLHWDHGDAGEAAAAAVELANEGDAEAMALAALLHGPLTRSCFAWGPAAAALQQLPPPPAAAANGFGEAQQQQQQRQRLHLLQQRLPLDPARAALTASHWPEACTLAAPGSSSQQTPSGTTGSGGSSSSGSSSGQLAQLPGCAAAYDPGFLLPFCCCCLRQQLLGPRAFAEAGLLSVCLRGLAAADAGCRAAAYQALALFEEQLSAVAAPDFREKQQLSVLLRSLRAAVTRPFQSLPAVHAVFLAEAALLALHPDAAMYPSVNKHLTRRAVLSTTDVPLLGQLLMSGGQQHAAERRWMLQLLLAGLRSADDAALYRRKHVFEQAMALHDSCVTDPSLASLALHLLCTATYIPRAARQLAQESGLIPWLAGAAQAAIQQQAQRWQRSGSGGSAAEEEEAVTAPLAALRRLLQLRAVMRGASGAAAAQQMATAALQLAAAAQGAAGAGGSAGGGCASGALVCRHVLPFLQDVQEQLGPVCGGQRGQQQHGRRTHGSSWALAEVAVAVEALRTVAAV